MLVENGQLIKRNMDRERLSLDDLAEQARLNDIASVDDVRWAILENQRADQLHQATAQPGLIGPRLPVGSPDDGL